jgi:gluconate 5-dehydrogenase
MDNYTIDQIKNLFNLDGKVAVITGGSGVLGEAMAVGLAAYGAKVVVAGRNQENLDKSVAKIVEAGGEGYAVSCDVNSPEGNEKLVEDAIAKFGKVDILIACAGICKRFPAEEFTPDDFKTVIDVNVNGCFLSCQAVGKQMIKQGTGGKIITISSVRANNGHPLGYAAYAASKAAVVGLTKQLSTEWAKYGILVNSLAPTVVVTPLTKPIFDDPEKAKIFTDRIPLGRPAIADEIVGTALYLAAPASDFITGQTIYVDGGCVAG